jgi:hypothetical protein
VVSLLFKPNRSAQWAAFAVQQASWLLLNDGYRASGRLGIPPPTTRRVVRPWMFVTMSHGNVV